MIRKQKRKMLEDEKKIELIRKRLCPTRSFKYLGVKIYENLNWHHFINDPAAKLHRAIPSYLTSEIMPVRKY